MIGPFTKICSRASRSITISQSFYGSSRSHVNLAAILLARFYASKALPSHTIIPMPALSPTMTMGGIGVWQKKPGDRLSPGDVLVEIETDKAQMDFEFQDEGVLAKILRETGSKDVTVGSPIAVFVESEEDVAAFENFTAEDAGGTPVSDKGDSQSERSTVVPSNANDSGSESTQEVDKSSDSITLAVESESSESEGSDGYVQPALDRERLISPAARKLALEKGIPIDQVVGSGNNGLILPEDVEKFSGTANSSTGARSGTDGGRTTIGIYEDLDISSMRSVIANRLIESTQQNPHYFVSSSISVTKLLKLRAALNSSSNGTFRLSLNDIIIKAVSLAARKVPAVNSSWRSVNGKNVIRQYNTVDVSVAVATSTGLITPIVENADTLGLQEISKRVKYLSGLAREGGLKPEQYQGGTITISNMGMNPAVERFTAIINPPQAAIIAVGTVRKVAVPANMDNTMIKDDLTTNNVRWDDQITITCSFDHKVVDGAVGAEFIGELRRLMENPFEMLL